MPTPFHLTVVAPDRTIVDEPVTALVAPAVTGYLGVLAHHAPLIAALKVGFLAFVDSNDQRHYVAVGGGFLETSSNGAIVLANTAERATDIDRKRAEAALERARAALRGEDSSMSTAEAFDALERALNRIQTARRAGIA